MGAPCKQSKTQRSKRTCSQPSQQTGLLPVLAVTAVLAGFIWWRRHKQGTSQPKKSPQERGSKFAFPKGKVASAGNARSKASTNNKKNRKDRKEELKARQQRASETSKPSGSKETDEKEKEPLIFNYTYFVPDRTDQMSAPAIRMSLPPKEK